MMKPQLLKSLLAFLIFNSSILISAKAQIVYTDVNPDQTFNTNGSIYNLDLNNDGIEDFVFQIYGHTSISWKTGHSYTTVYANVTSQGTNKFISSAGLAAELLQNDIIDSGSDWNSSPSQYLMYWHQEKAGPNIISNISQGLWNNAVDKYVGVKLIAGGQIYYGWIRLNVSVSLTSASMTIKDFAYDSIANHFILAGESSCSIPTVTISASGPLTFCNGSYVTLTANGTGHLYQWKKNGVDLIGAKYQSLNVSMPGRYKCVVTNTCGTKTSKTDTIKVPCRNAENNEINTQSINMSDRLNVYPNPATNSLTIKFPSDKTGEISIVNLFGQIVFSEKINSDEMKVDVSKFSAGMYAVSWISGESIQTQKFSIIK